MVVSGFHVVCVCVRGRYCQSLETMSTGWEKQTLQAAPVAGSIYGREIHSHVTARRWADFTSRFLTPLRRHDIGGLGDAAMLRMTHFLPKIFWRK